MHERFAFGKIDDPAQYNKFRLKKQVEINQVKGKSERTDYEISNLFNDITEIIKLSDTLIITSKLSE